MQDSQTIKVLNSCSSFQHSHIAQDERRPTYDASWDHEVHLSYYSTTAEVGFYWIPACLSPNGYMRARGWF